MPSQRSNTIARAKPDPIFEAIYRCARADAASKESVRFRLALAKVAPTTLEGLTALASFLDLQSSILGSPFFDNKREHLAFYESLHRSLVTLTRARAAA
jgi:hypothetical protein